jgi:AraC-like DNA-binding protein
MHCDMHLSQYFSDLQVNAEMFSIDHCREGRMECRLTNGQSICLDAGSAIVHAADGIMPEFFCPTSHYHGLTLAFFLEEAQEGISTLFSGVGIDLRRLRDKFCEGRLPILLPKENVPCSLFSYLYELPQNGSWQLQRLKLLEALLYLLDLDISGIGKRSYFYKTQVEKVKAVEHYMMENLSVSHTIGSLADRFGFPLTSMKLCFKGVFGLSIYAYMRNQRMSAAARRLRETGDRVSDIAASVGYENASKFAVAFRACMGKSPNEYRKQSIADGRRENDN